MERILERRDVTRNRAKLLAAADEVVRMHGEDATIEAIARQAGLGVGTAYRHFANKQVLLEALFAPRIERVLEFVDEASRVDEAGSALEMFIQEVAWLYARDRGLRDAISLAASFEGLSHLRERLAAGVGHLVDRSKAAGAVRSDLEATDIPLVFWIVGAVADYADDVDRQLWRRYLEILLDGIRPQNIPRRSLPVDALRPDQLGAAIRNQATPTRTER